MTDMIERLNDMLEHMKNDYKAWSDMIERLNDMLEHMKRMGIVLQCTKSFVIVLTILSVRSILKS